MTRRMSVAVVMLIGVVLGSLGTHALSAQKPPSALYIAEVDVQNVDEFNSYAAGVPPTIEKYGGRYLVRGGKSDVVEGQPPKRIVVTMFKSMADARKWYDSPEYSALRPIRQRSAQTRSFIVETVGE